MSQSLATLTKVELATTQAEIANSTTVVLHCPRETYPASQSLRKLHVPKDFERPNKKLLVIDRRWLRRKD